MTKLILGIIATMISVVILLASVIITALGYDIDGLIALIVGMLMLTAGIIDITTRKTKSGAKICCIFFLVAGAIGMLLSKFDSAMGKFGGISVVLGIANFIVLKKQLGIPENAIEGRLEDEKVSNERDGDFLKIGRTVFITLTVTAIIVVALGRLLVSIAGANDVSRTDNDSETNSQNNYNNSYSNNSESTIKDVELEETGFCMRLNYVESLQYNSGDKAYIRYVGFVKNPNQSRSAVFPTLAVTIKNKDGAVIATGETSKGVILPGDIVPVTGEISVDVAAIDDESKIYYQVSCSQYVESHFDNLGVRTTDFTSTNISERTSGNKNIVTGEVTNNSKEDCNMSEIVLVMRNNGDIVYTNHTYMYNLAQGQTRAFEFEKYGNWPEHDEVQVVVSSAM